MDSSSAETNHLPLSMINMRSRRLQLKLKSVFALMILAGALSLWLSVVFDNRPIEWVAYSDSEFKRYVQLKNNSVLIFFTADWDITANLVEKEALNDYWVRWLIRRNGIVAMKADLTQVAKRHEHGMERMISIGRTATPVIAIYEPRNLENPTILEGFIDAESLRSAIGGRR